MALADNLAELGELRRVLEAAGDGKSFGSEVRAARKQRGMTLDALAKASGMAKSYLSQIETGYAPPPREEKIRRIARALGLPEDVLVARAHLAQLPADLRAQIARLRMLFDSTEEVIRALLAAKTKAKPPEGGVEAPTDASPSINLDDLYESGLLHHLAEWGGSRVGLERQGLRTIPVINKVAAGYPKEFTDLGYPVGIADEYVAAPAELSDPNAFAVHVVGDSMEPRYHEGDLVILSPAATVASGSDCFVRFAAEGRPQDSEATFKRVFFDGPESVRLQPLNERYAPRLLKPSEIEGIYRAVARHEKL